jgi:predicted transcriptional regulator of viral defense system
MKYYEDLLKQEVFTFEDAQAVIGSVEATKKTLQRYKKSGLVKHIQRELYYTVNLENRNTTANRYIIASKINKDAYLVCHSAFEIHGFANQVSFEAWVASEKRFKDFEFEGTRYRYAGKGINIGIIHYKLNSKIKVTDLERTVVDSLKNIEYAGGLHELDECLTICPMLDNHKLQNYLAKYDIQFLYKKAGYFLERYQKQLGVANDLLELCEQKSGRSLRYLGAEAQNGSGKLIKRWQLIVLSDLESRVSEESDLIV